MLNSVVGNVLKEKIVMKVLLIETSRTYHGKSKGVRLSVPLGLLYIGAILEEDDIEVSLFNSLVCPKTRVKEQNGFLHHGVNQFRYFRNFKMFEIYFLHQ